MALTKHQIEDIAADAANLRDELLRGEFVPVYAQQLVVAAMPAIVAACTSVPEPAVPEPDPGPSKGYLTDVRTCRHCHARIAARGPRPDWACLDPQSVPALSCPGAPGDFPLHEPADQAQ